MNNFKKIDLGFAVLSVEQAEFEGGWGFAIVLEDHDGLYIQDIVSVLPTGAANMQNIVECLVWADETTEDYTHQFFIKKYEED